MFKHKKEVAAPIDTSDIEQRRKLMVAAEGRLQKFDNEFVAAYKILQKFPKTVTFFGSARLKRAHPYYKLARTLGEKLSAEGFTVVTGGGAGIMQAGNHGAYDHGAETIGFNISLPNEQILNRYVTHHASFHYFFTRKVMLTFFADAYIYFPGGYGTLDELFEVLTLVQTRKMPRVPIILVDKKFWSPLDKFIKKYLLASRTISPGDENLYHMTDDLDQVVKMVKRLP